MKIIGCGNRDRGDDQAGLLVSERLRELGLDAETYAGDPLSLFQRWSAYDNVIVVDAILTGAPAGTVRVWDRELPHVSGGLVVSSHGFDIGKGIELAQALNRLPARLRVYGIEGRQFDQGAGISPEVERAVESVVRQILGVGTQVRKV